MLQCNKQNSTTENPDKAHHQQVSTATITQKNIPNQATLSPRLTGKQKKAAAIATPKQMNKKPYTHTKPLPQANQIRDNNLKQN